MPYINWSLDFSGDTATAFSQLVAGAKDLYLRKCADEFRSYSKPVFISFCPSFNKEQSAQRFSESYVRSWQYVYTFFNNLGISNLCWVWNPALSNAKLFYPGPKFTDWVGVSCLNYGASSKDDNWYSFSQLYEPYRTQLSSFGKPVMVSEFGTLTGPHQVAWINNSLSEIQKNFPEIRGLVFFDQKKDFTMKAGSRDSVYYSADFSLKGRENWAQVAPSLSREPFSNEPFKGIEVPAVATPAPHSRKIKGAPGKFELLVDGKPYYIRGVAYNTAHDWRDGNTPLTRRQVEKDFERIKAMGANTIRRYDHSIYDRNVLNIAAEFDLRVLYGFWFDPKVDYYTDSVRVKEYTDKVIEKVLEYKDHSSVLAWSLGNETWGQLKHRYSKPYLIEVRRSYVKMIETLAERIHEIDPERPVFTCIEHEEYQLPGEIVAFRDGAPSIDAVGVNSYYREQISKLNHVTWQFDSLRPYLVSEFGPRGYWDPSYNRTRNGKLIEDSEKEKALWYKDQWTNYVSSFKGYNIGGFAYCWHDRMEGSYTWFGLTDYKSRLKPGYYALKELWTNEKIQGLPQFSITMPDKLVAGQEYTCTATCAGLASQNYTYEWYLHKNDYLERVDAVESINEGQSVQLKVPQDHLNYRLYLYVSDDKGNVSTASAPVDVR